jgi:hypothetical protein
MNLDTRSSKHHATWFALAAALWTTACGGSAFLGGGSGGADGGAGARAGAGGSGAGGSGAGGSGAGGSGAGAAGGAACNVGCPLILCKGTSVTHPGDCCPTCETGGSGGVTGGGTAGAGGSCAETACPALACAMGYHFENQPGACCPTCVPDDVGGSGGTGGCAAVDCAEPKCLPGYMLQQQPDACCPVCVPSAACTMGQQGYKMLRTSLLAQPGALACKVDQDCALLGSNAYCGDQCSQVPVNAAAAQSIYSALSSYATSNCSTCTPLWPPCAVPPPAACVQGQCALGMFSGG